MAQPHHDRRHLGTPETLTSLTEDGIVQETVTGQRYRELKFAEVQEVRLNVEMAARASQVVCRVKGATGSELVFGSMRFKAPGVFESEIDSFQPLLRSLHEALLSRADKIAFIEGPSRAFLVAMFVLGALLSLLAAGFFYILAVMQENPAGFFLLAVLGTGVWMMRLFYPRAPSRYDPARFIQAEAAIDPADQ